MKKKVFASMAIATLTVGIASCSHDIEVLSPEEIDQQNYERAFLSYIGGKIAPDQDWGFSNDAEAAKAHTRAPKQKYNKPADDIPELRIIAEDLSATEGSDFDFNDAVIDISFGKPAKVWLVAAGGTLPLYICQGGDDQEKEDYEYIEDEEQAEEDIKKGIEVHQAFGVSTSTMVNTGIGDKKDPVELDFKKGNGNGHGSQGLVIKNANAAHKIQFYVQKKQNGKLEKMTTKTGKVPCKIAVIPTFKILKERSSIKKEYPKFTEWVQDNKVVRWYDVPKDMGNNSPEDTI